MIEIRTCEHGFSAVGHAGHGPPGHDIVCAAVSVLVQTFALSAEELPGDQISCDIQPGRAVIEYGNLSDRARLLKDSLFIGVRAIAESYPDCVKFMSND